MLAAHGLRATFFVVGEALRAHRALAERAHAEGHWIGNHTLTHPRPRNKGKAKATSAAPASSNGVPATEPTSVG